MVRLSAVVRRRSPAALLAAGALAAPLFVVVFLVEGATRRGYEPLREPVSALALGPRGWVQKASFIGTGLAMLGLARGLQDTEPRGMTGSTWAPRLVGVYAAGLVGAGVFVTDPVRPTDVQAGVGQPPEAVAAGPGLQGALHVVFSMQVFAALGAAGLVYARQQARAGERAWAAWSAATGSLVPGGIVLFGQALGRADRLGSIAGLIQRVTIALGWGWLTGLALYRLDALAASTGRGGRRRAGA